MDQGIHTYIDCQFLDLEKMLHDLQMKSATLLEKRARGWMTKNRYRSLRGAALVFETGENNQSTVS